MPLTPFKPFIDMHLNQIIQPQQVHQMTTRSMNNIFKTKQLNFMTKNPLLETIKPTSVHQAISQPYWHEVMSSELIALMCMVLGT